MSDTKLGEYCGVTDAITSQDYASCQFASGSYVFAVLTGFCIGSLSLANIIGVAYVNKKMSLKTLTAIVIVFEAAGMLAISRYTLQRTVRSTINFAGITNLRKGFIVLGSTQMCSAMILVNVVIFKLPMSSTQVVISGLTGVSLIYLTNELTTSIWFLIEIMIWVLIPLICICMVYFAQNLVRTHIF